MSLTMGCVVVTDPFDLTVVGARHPFTIPNRIQTHIGSICEPTRVDTFVICLSPKAFLWGTMHGFADTVRFRGRGLIVDRALSTGHNRIIRGGAVMPFMCCFVPACRQAAHMSTISFWCVSLRTRCERCQVRQRTWKQQSHSTCAPDNNTSWLLARGVQCVDWVPELEVLCAPSSC